MKTILVPTDFSPSAYAALRVAMVIARQQKAQIQVLHAYLLPYSVAPIPPNVLRLQSETEEQIRKERLNDFCATMAAEGDISYSKKLVAGDAAESIIKAANASDTGLIVMGTHGERDVIDHLFGTTATSVIEKAPCPVVAVPASAQIGKDIRTIAYATDYRHADLAAIATIVSWARPMDAEVVLLHVSPDAHDPAKEVNNLYELLKNAEQLTGYQKLSCELLTGDDVESKLIDYTTSAKSSMLVMSSQQRGWFERLFRPSLSADLAEDAPVPVVVFHHRKESSPKIFV